MKIKRNFLLPITILFLLTTTAKTQVKVANDADLSTPTDPSAALEVFSTTKGFLPPRVTTVQRNAIVAPAEGLTIFNTDTDCLNTFGAGVWKNYCVVDRDHDFYTVGTSLPPTNINQNQYTYGSISYGNTAIQNKATGANSLAGGLNSTVSGAQGFAFGSTNSVTAGNSMAGGASNDVAGGNTMVSGNNNSQSGGGNSLLVGTLNINTSSNSMIAGNSNNSAGNKVLVGGNNNSLNSVAQNAIVGGNSNVIQAPGVLAVGGSHLVTGEHSLVGGFNNIVRGERMVVAGQGISSNGNADHSFVGGESNIVNNKNNLVLGAGNNVSNTNNMVAGSGNVVSGVENSVSGQNNSTTRHRNVIGGTGNTISNNNNIVGGNANSVGATTSLVIGSSNLVSGNPNANMIAGTSNTVQGNLNCVSGNTNKLTTHTSGASSGNMVTGIGNEVGGRYNVVGGRENKILTTNAPATGTVNLVVGLLNQISNGDGNLVAGSNNVLNPGADYSIVVGRNNVTSNEHAFAMGYNNTATHRNSWAIGGTANGGVASSVNHQFNAVFIGGYRYYSNQALTTGVRLNANSSTWASVSDRRAKENLTTLSYGLKEILQLRPLLYQYKSSSKSSLGFVAQEVESVLPEIVDTPVDKEDFLTLRYTELIPVLTKAIQEQQTVIESLKKELSTANEELGTLKATNVRMDALEAQFAEMKALIEQ